jgi:hypothetical protein
MSSSADPTASTAPKKDRGRKNVIVPVVPIIPKAVMSRKERRKSKHAVDVTPDAGTAHEDAGKADKAPQDIPLENGVNSGYQLKEEGTIENVTPDPAIPSEERTQNDATAELMEHQGEKWLH